MQNAHKTWLTVFRVLMIALWSGLIVLCIINRDKFTVEGIVQLKTESNWLTMLILFALFALKSVSVVVHVGILYAASGVLFPLPQAILVNLIGTVITVAVPYWIGRAAGAHAIAHIAERHPGVAGFFKMSHKNDLFVSFLTRIMGVLPADIVSLYLGAVKARFGAYMLGSVLGLLVSAVTFPIMGTNIMRPGSSAFLVPAGINAALMLLSVILYILYRRKQRRQEGKENHGT